MLSFSYCFRKGNQEIFPNGQTTDTPHWRGLKSAPMGRVHKILFLSLPQAVSHQRGENSLTSALILRLNLPIHNHQFQKFQAAHNLYTITSPSLIPLTEVEQRNNFFRSKTIFGKCISLSNSNISIIYHIKFFFRLDLRIHNNYLLP